MPDLTEPSPEELRELLSSWWFDRTHAEVDAVVPKAIEYGANSMIEVGRTMARLSHRQVTDEEATELACMFYIAGKVGRWVDAAAEGKRPSDDTIYDIGIYAKMAQRVRDVGGWPFGPEPAPESAPEFPLSPTHTPEAGPA